MDNVTLSKEAYEALLQDRENLQQLRSDVREGGQALKQIFERLGFWQLITNAVAGQEISKRQFAKKLAGLGQQIMFGSLELEDLLSKERIEMIGRLLKEFE